MERQNSFSFNPTRIIFFSLSILFSLFFSFWAFSTTLSSSSQTQLRSAGVSVSAIDAFPPSSAIISAPRPNDTVSLEISDVSSSNSHGEALDSPRSGQNDIFSDALLCKGPISSCEGIDVVGEKKNELSRNEGSTHVGKSSLQRTDSMISNFSGLISNGGSNSAYKKSTTSVFAEHGANSCNLWDGKWVYDESYPLYLSNECPYIDEGFSCEINGRTDREYMKWRWQPANCNIPRFNPAKFLELIRGKRIVFVGDSISRNQWESMMCLLRKAITDPSRIHEARRRVITKENGVYNFKFTDYRCSIEYYVTHFLVHESKARVGKKRSMALRIDTIDRSSLRWKGADVLVFNTAHWWSHYKTKAGLNFYQEGGKVLPHLDVSTAYRRALTTWASWVDRNVNPNKTRVFFRSSAPSHFSGGEWSSGGHCKESTQPLNHTFTATTPEKNLIVDQIISQMRTPVTVLNVTSLSGLRIDGHPSVYGRRPGAGTPSSVEDCSHWCLPGVPDAWNELLYFYLKP